MSNVSATPLNPELAQEWHAQWTKLLDTRVTGNDLGNCYMNAANFVMEKGDKDGRFEGSQLLLCHADVTRDEDGLRHGHAWVEWGDGVGMVFDPSNGKPDAAMFLLPLYYEWGQVDPDQVQRFDREQVFEQLVKTEVFGPWEQP